MDRFACVGCQDRIVFIREPPGARSQDAAENGEQEANRKAQHGAAERIWVRPVRSSYATLVRSNNSESSTKYITNRMRTISYGSGRAQLPPALARSCDSLTSLNTVRSVGC